MSDNNDKTASVIAAFVVGGVVGAALGVLFAPKTGKETRADIKDWVDDTMETSKEKFHKLGDEIKHRKEQLAQAVRGDGKNAA